MHDECDERDGFRGPTLLWRRPICLGRSAGLDAGGGVRGRRVCRARTSKREDEAGASQVTVECGHMFVSEAAARAAFTMPSAAVFN